jgi:hypothetical protein
MEYESRVTKMIICIKDQPIFDNSVLEIFIDDEGGGEFLVIKQIHDAVEPGTIKMDKEEWPLIRKTIETMLKKIKGE